MDYIFYASGRTWHIVKGALDYAEYPAEVKRVPSLGRPGHQPGDGDTVQRMPANQLARANVLCGSLAAAHRPNGFDIETGGLEVIAFIKVYQAWLRDRTRELVLGYKIKPPQIMPDAPFPPAPLCRHCAKIARIG